MGDQTEDVIRKFLGSFGEPIPNSGETHLHFLVWAAHVKTETGFSEVTDVDVIAPDEESALARARIIAPGRAYYFVKQVVEHHAHNDPMIH